MLSTLGPEGSRTLRENPERIEAVNEEVRRMGAEVIEQYALLGHYDFMTVLEAPDALTMANVATQLGSRGTLKTVTLTAIPVAQFISRMSASHEHHDDDDRRDDHQRDDD